jgi:capsular exopolysaccharide synthesis family protein
MRREQSLAGELNQTKSDAMSLNSAAVEYNNLKLEVSTRRQLLDEMLRRQSETEVASRVQGGRESNIRVVDEALVPGAPYLPSLRKDVTLGMVLGLVLGVGAIFLLEYLDRTIKSPDELERLLGLPVLAVIPETGEHGRSYGSRGYGYGYGYGYGARRSKKRDKSANATPIPEPPIELIPHARPRLVVSEAYRALRTALLLSSAQELKLVAITSSESSEGKTSTASNLAVVMAQLGRRVVVVDGDLRKPRQHEIFRQPNRAGVVNYLTGSAKIEQMTLKTDIPNLWLVPSGPIPPNPSELLASTRMTEMLAALRASFDFVIVDTPPVLAVTDATLIGSMVDGMVLCLRARKVQREDARACRDRLLLNEVRILGTVLNRFRATQGSYSKHYQQYAAYVAEDADDSTVGSATA